MGLLFRIETCNRIDSEILRRAFEKGKLCTSLSRNMMQRLLENLSFHNVNATTAAKVSASNILYFFSISPKTFLL
jgi:hypothetical protein